MTEASLDPEERVVLLAVERGLVDAAALEAVGPAPGRLRRLRAQGRLQAAALHLLAGEAGVEGAALAGPLPVQGRSFEHGASAGSGALDPVPRAPPSGLATAPLELADSARTPAPAGDDRGRFDAAGTETPVTLRAALPHLRADQEPPPPPQPLGQRYQLLGLLGVGGMAKVYKARDLELRRLVALKCVLAHDPALEHRVVEEAQAQARIDHQNVCKVYEVGRIGGQLFLAMQYVQGGTLRDAAARLTLNQKVTVLVEVAEAVHAAHLLGIIHRDLKPSNILVEQRPDGGVRPYVTDFGLARDLTAPGSTATGAILGTPQYMAPEQARGEVHRIDRRTDVYGLGATAFEVLSGRQPFEGMTGVHVLYRSLNDELPSLRKLAPGLPLDLDVIVHKAMEREPRRRYDSAQALADDLRRFLAGEPILARRPPLAERLQRSFRRNRALWLVAGAALAGLLALSAVNLRTQWQAGQQAALAQRFGQEVKELEWSVRFGALLPLHDTRRERAEVRAKMERLSEEIARGGRLATGPGEVALGRAALALHDAAAARLHLESAWAAGYRQPEVSDTLGLALGELYSAALEEAERLPDEAQRTARRAAAERDLRDPALALLREGGASRSGTPELVEGLIAFYERRWTDAVAKAAEAFARAPLLFEARTLEARAEVAGGREKMAKGELEAAAAAFDRAGSALAAALEIARSDGAALRVACERLLHVSTLTEARGAAPDALAEEGDAACARAAVAVPDDPKVFGLRAALAWHQATWLQQHDGDAAPAVARALAAAREALRLAPDDVAGREALASSLWTLGESELAQGKDPRPTFAQAVQAYRATLAVAPALASPYNNLAGLYREQHDYELDRGLDPARTLAAGLAAAREAVRLAPQIAQAWENQGGLLAYQAVDLREAGQDPDATFARALESLERAAAVNPASSEAKSLRGYALAEQAAGWLARGRDPSPLLALAEEAQRAALALNPANDWSRAYLALARQVAARHALRTGADPGPALDEALAGLRRALGVNGGDPWLTVALVDTLHLAVRDRLARGGDPLPLLAEAQQALAGLRRTNPSVPGLAALGRHQTLAARVARSRGKQPGPALDAASAALAEALTLAPASAVAHLAAADLALVRATAPGLQRPAALEALARGLSDAEAALRVRPGWPEADAAAGRLLVARASLLRGEEAHAAAVAAKAALEAALSGDALLARELEAPLAQARRLGR